MVRFASAVATALLAANSFISASSAHAMPIPEERDGTQYPNLENGTDAPADPATTGYFINHLALNVLDMGRSVEFHTKIFGMRKLFTLQVSPHYSVTYLGHSHGGENGTGYQTNAELSRDKNKIAGLLELVSVSVPHKNLSASTRIPNTFSHIGMVVPDIKATQKRLDKHRGVNIIKRSGDDVSKNGPVDNAISFTPEIVSQLSPSEMKLIERFLAPFTKEFIYVTDPDGNLVEIQPRQQASLS